MELTTAERVDAGVAWLNEKGPAEWVDLIDINRIDMNDPFNCILGQAFAPRSLYESGYNYALDVYDLWNDAYNMGFSDIGPLEYSSLDFQWKLTLRLLKMEMAA